MKFREKLEPIGDRIIVLRDKPEEYSKGGIALPPPKDEIVSGVVVAVGPGDVMPKTGERRTLALKPLHHVRFARNAGMEVQRDGETLVFLHESDVFGFEGKR